MKKAVIYIQVVYYLLTALWPLIDIHSFMVVSGPKTDIWLVKTVAVLLIPISLCLLFGLSRNNYLPLVILLAVGSAIGLLFIDIYYVYIGEIDPIYLADGGIQFAFIICWSIIGFRERADLRF